MCLSDDAQGAFGPNEDLIEIRTAGMLWYRQSVNDISVGKDYLHANALIINFPVLS